MSSSLRDQLLKAGLVTEKQVKKAEQQRRAPPKPKAERGLPNEQEIAAQRARAEKAARDQALSRKQQEKADKAARWAQVRQLIEQNRLPPVETEEQYRFTDGKTIKSVPATADMRQRLGRGELAIVRCDGRYHVVSAATAERVRERVETAVIPLGTTAGDESAKADDPYKDFVVPDDITW